MTDCWESVWVIFSIAIEGLRDGNTEFEGELRGALEMSRVKPVL